MKKKQNFRFSSYLERRPKRAKEIGWMTEKDGTVTLKVKNTGWANRLSQVLFGRPKVSCVHLDDLGSFVWQRLEGKDTVRQIGSKVDGEFGERAHPLYERLVHYFRILDSYHFVEWAENE